MKNLNDYLNGPVVIAGESQPVHPMAKMNIESMARWCGMTLEEFKRLAGAMPGNDSRREDFLAGKEVPMTMSDWGHFADKGYLSTIISNSSHMATWTAIQKLEAENNS